MRRNKILIIAFSAFAFYACDYIRKSGELVFNRYRVSTPAMSPALNVGEIYPVFSVETFAANQIVTFHPPSKFRGENEDVVWLHRLTGMPGDTIEMKQGILFRNGAVFNPRLRLKHSYLVTTTMPLNTARIEDFEYHSSGYNEYVFHATSEEIARLKNNKAIKEIRPGIYGPDHPVDYREIVVEGKNRDNWGPLIVPSKGMSILIADENQRQYESIFTEYEIAEKIPVPGDKIEIRQDYYFVLGDNRHNALDSRYIGFIPRQNLKGIMAVNNVNP